MGMWQGLLTSLLLLVVLLVCLETGRRIGLRHRLKRESAGATAAADGVVFAMLGLLIAFTFTSSASRFDERRELIVQQANVAATAWQRLDMLPANDRDAVREPMRQWFQIAGNLSEVAHDPELARTTLDKAEALQRQSWAACVEAIDRLDQPALATFLLSPMNEWADLSTSRRAMEFLGLPPMVLPTLVILALVASVLAGFSMSRTPDLSPLHMFAFAVAVSFAIFVILDLGSPRSGLIRLDQMDHVFVKTLENLQIGQR